jgi:hypothetical protein
MNTTCGFPNTLPPLGVHDLRACLWFAATGVILLSFGLFPALVPSGIIGKLILLAWLALPAWAYIALFSKRRKARLNQGSTVQARIYTIVVIAFGLGFVAWARQLGLAWEVIIGALFLIESLPGVVISLTEWWRLSHLGICFGLMVCGFGFPFADQIGVRVLAGGAIVAGSFISAAILFWQVRLHRSANGLSG